VPGSPRLREFDSASSWCGAPILPASASASETIGSAPPRETITSGSNPPRERSPLAPTRLGIDQLWLQLGLGYDQLWLHSASTLLWLAARRACDFRALGAIVLVLPRASERSARAPLRLGTINSGSIRLWDCSLWLTRVCFSGCWAQFVPGSSSAREELWSGSNSNTRPPCWATRGRRRFKIRRGGDARNCKASDRKRMIPVWFHRTQPGSFTTRLFFNLLFHGFGGFLDVLVNVQAQDAFGEQGFAQLDAEIAQPLYDSWGSYRWRKNPLATPSRRRSGETEQVLDLGSSW